MTTKLPQNSLFVPFHQFDCPNGPANPIGPPSHAPHIPVGSSVDFQSKPHLIPGSTLRIGGLTPTELAQNGSFVSFCRFDHPNSPADLAGPPSPNLHTPGGTSRLSTQTTPETQTHPENRGLTYIHQIGAGEDGLMGSFGRSSKRNDANEPFSIPIGGC